MNKINWDEWEECDMDSYIGQEAKDSMLLAHIGKVSYFKRKAKTVFEDEQFEIKVGEEKCQG